MLISFFSLILLLLLSYINLTFIIFSGIDKYVVCNSLHKKYLKAVITFCIINYRLYRHVTSSVDIK